MHHKYVAYAGITGIVGRIFRIIAIDASHKQFSTQAHFCSLFLYLPTYNASIFTTDAKWKIKSRRGYVAPSADEM